MSEAIITDGRIAPQARIPVWVLRSAEWATLVDASPVAAHVLLVLWSYSRQNTAWCSVRRLSTMVGAYRKTIYTALKLLQEHGWISEPKERRTSSGQRQADLYDLLYPGTVKTCADQINAALTKRGQPVTSELYREGDIFAWNGGVHVRQARIDQPVIASVQFGALRRVGAAFRAYLLLIAYGAGERISVSRLALEARYSREETIKEGWRWLVQHGWISTERRQGPTGQELEHSFHLLDRQDLIPARSPEDPKQDLTPATPATPAKCCSVCGCGCGGRVAEPEPVAEPVPEPVAEPADFWLSLDEWVQIELFERMGKSVRHEPRTVLEAMAKAVGWEPPVKTEIPVWPFPERMVREWHEAIRKVPAACAAPSAKELQLASTLVQQYGESNTFELLKYAVKEQRRTKFAAASFCSVRELCKEGARLMGIA